MTLSICALLPTYSSRLSLVFVKTFLVHCYNTCTLLFVTACLLNFHINVFKFIGKLFTHLFSFTFIVSLVLTFGLQFISCCCVLRLVNFKPLIFARNIDKVVHFLSRPLTLATLIIMSIVQTNVFYYMFIGTLPHRNSMLIMISTSAAFSLHFVMKILFTDYGFCSPKFLNRFEYVYVFPADQLLSNLTFYARLIAILFSMVAFFSQVFSLIGIESLNFHLFAPESMLLDRLFSFPALVAATFLTQLLFKVFVYLFKFWLAEPVNTDQLSSKTFNQVALADLKSENYFVKRNALETLKVYLTKSAQCRKSVYAVSSRTNDSKLWTEILGEVLLNVSDQTEKLKRFRFLVRRQRINNNQQGGPQDKTVAEIKPSRLDFSRNLTSERLEVTTHGDVKKSNPNVSMSFFATQVADPFGPWDTMSHHNSSGYNVSKQPRGVRQTAVQDRVIAGMSHFEVLHSWFADSRPVVFLFDKNESAMLATQFEDSAVVSKISFSYINF